MRDPGDEAEEVDIVDEAGMASFPASDPPPFWGHLEPRKDVPDPQPPTS